MKSYTQKQEEAIERNRKHAALTVEQKLEQCLNRRGDSIKEVQRLQIEGRSVRNG